MIDFFDYEYDHASFFESFFEKEKENKEDDSKPDKGRPSCSVCVSILWGSLKASFAIASAISVGLLLRKLCELDGGPEL